MPLLHCREQTVTMQLMHCIICLTLFDYAFGVIVHEKVVFHRVMKYCSLRNAILPVNLNHLCVLAFFTKEDKWINRFCRRMVEPNAILPMATYISADG